MCLFANKAELSDLLSKSQKCCLNLTTFMLNQNSIKSNNQQINESWLLHDYDFAHHHHPASGYINAYNRRGRILCGTSVKECSKL